MAENRIDSYFQQNAIVYCLVLTIGNSWNFQQVLGVLSYVFNTIRLHQIRIEDFRLNIKFLGIIAICMVFELRFDVDFQYAPFVLVS